MRHVRGPISRNHVAIAQGAIVLSPMPMREQGRGGEGRGGKGEGRGGEGRGGEGRGGEEREEKRREEKRREEKRREEKRREEKRSNMCRGSMCVMEGQLSKYSMYRALTGRMTYDVWVWVGG